MDLELSDFNEAFLNSEIIPIKLKTMGNKAIYLRHLCRADITRFRALCKEINVRSSFNVFADPDNYKKVRDADLEAAEDYLLVKSICNRNGEILFKDVKHYKDWSKNVSNDPIEEILKAIKDKILFPTDEGFKKKEK